jgi:hypothetical protein
MFFGTRKFQNGKYFIPMISTPMTRKQVTDWILVTFRESAWAPLSVIGLYLLGLVFGVYDRYPLMDVPTHFLGGVAITYFFRFAIRNSQAIFGEIPFPVQVMFALTCTGTTIILWEFLEVILDFLFQAHNVLGLADTIKDMFVGLMGALVITIFYRRR